MKNTKNVWIIPLIVGISFFVIPLIIVRYDSINGFSGICFVGYKKYYGIKAFVDSIYLCPYIFWPLYIIGIVLIILSITKLKTMKK